MYWAMAVVSEKKGNGNSGNGYGLKGSSKLKPRTLAVVDAPPTIGKFVNAIQDILAYTGATTVTDLILTHHHKDHIDNGNAVMAQWPQARVISQEAVKEILTDGRDPGNRPIPTVTFKTNYTLSAYGLELYYPGPNHSPGNFFVYHPASKTLMFDDVVFPKWVPFKLFAQSTDIPNWIKAFQTILSYDFTTYIGGHLSTMGNRDDAIQSQQFVNDVMAGAQHALSTVDPNPFAVSLGVNDPTNPNYGNWWLWFSEYLDACADFCYQEIAPKWLGVIGAVDVFGPSQCDAAVESIRID
jgi:glyoxylase-like metal-dependent hydrolase (beta-lactamase superfamily II)